MQPEQRAFVLILCDRMAREQDPDKFHYLLQQLEVALDSLHPNEHEFKRASQ